MSKIMKFIRNWWQLAVLIIGIVGVGWFNVAAYSESIIAGIGATIASFCGLCIVLMWGYTRQNKRGQ